MEAELGRVKQVILIRKDLKMRRGKEVAQGAHASAAWLTSSLRSQLAGAPHLAMHHVAMLITDVQARWLAAGGAKVCLRVNSEEELLQHHEAARAAGLESHLIRDSGRTEFGGVPTLTACAIGPDDAAQIDIVTGDLTLY